MLFDYQKQDGFTVGGISIGGKFKNKNAELIKQGNNAKFFKAIEENGGRLQKLDDAALKSMARHYKNVTDGAIEYVKAARDAGATGENLTANMLKQGSAAERLKGSFKNLGGTILKTLGNAALWAGISLAINGVISVISDFVDKSTLTADEAKNIADSFNASFDSMQEKTSSFSKSLVDYDEEFAELSKGVDSFGHNISLTEEEFARYREISNAVAEEMPELITMWNDQGEAVINLTDGINSLSEAYERNQQAQAGSLWRQKDEDGVDYATGVIANARDELVRGNGLRTTSPYLVQEYKKQIEELVSANEEELKELYFTGTNYQKQILQEGVKAGGDNIISMHSYLQSELSDINSDITYSTNQISKLAKTYAMQLDEYWSDLDESTRGYMNLILSNLDFDFILNQGLFNKKNLQDFVVYISSYLSDLSDDPEALKQIELRFNLETMFNNGEIVSVQDYLSKIAEIDQWIASLPLERQAIVRILFNVQEEDPIKAQRDQVEKFMQGKGAYAVDTRRFTNALSADELNLWSDALNGGEIPDDVIQAGYKSWMRFLQGLQKVAEQNEIKIKASDAVDSIADAKTAITSLEELYNQTVNETLALGKDKKYVDANGNVTKSLNDKNQALGYADPALINSVESSFYKFSDALKASGNDAAANQINAALEAFEKTLIEMPGDATAAQDAINKLITAYIDQTDIIKNLTEENAEWSKAQLTAMGITNAEEVVTSRLNKTVKKTQENIAQLALTITKYTDIIDSGNTKTKEYQEAMQALSNDVKKALTMYDENGNEIEIAYNFDDSFVEQHLADIRAMADGDVEALDRVRKAAAEEAFMSVNVAIPTEQVESQKNYLMDMIDALDKKDIEVGASLDDTQFIKGLNALISGTNMTAAQVQEAFSAMGYTVDVSYSNPKFTLPKINLGAGGKKGMADSFGIAALAGMQLSAQSMTMSIPQIKINSITRKGKGGVGKGAQYSPPASTPSGGGGGGGGGGSDKEPNKPKQESEEMFDWVEVAIQRLQEAEERLSKVVSNTYELWIERNKALGEEIGNVTEQIRAQQLAQQEYANYANSIQVNNGKGLNDDDYGENDELVKAADQALLDEANRLWATGEYQQKVREGLLSGDDIEKIANHFLSDTIKEFQEFYNKSVAASDAIQDLTIKLGDLAQAKFDNVKSEYEELIAYFTSYADIIDERINRSQEHGFFVSKDYYRQLLDYEQRELNQLNNEYADLIKTRDEAVASGAITEGSSAWNQMCQEINAVEKAIEESTTAMVEYNNAIRDIDWEIFDFTEDRIRRIIDETEFLTGLLSNDKLYEDDGRLTAIGEATNGMYAIQYETLMQQAKDYAEERKRLEAEMASDPAKQASKDYVQRLDEIIDAQQEAIESAEQMKDAVKGLVEEGINQHLSYLDELISKYEEMMDKEKSAYEYSKNIEKQVKNINNLQKMLDAYSGDDSEEARKTRQQTANQLEEAQQQLEETEWDKMISETKDLLTEMRDEYEEVLMARLDDVDLLMRDMIEHADANAQTIKETIETETFNVGYTLTEPLQNIFDKINNMNLAEDLNEKFKDSFKNALSSVELAIDNIKGNVYEMVGFGKALVDAEAKRQSEAAAEAEAERLRQEQAQREAENARNAEAQRQAQEEANRRAQEEANRKAQEEANRKAQEEAAAKASPQGDGSPNVGDKVTFVSGRYTQDSYGQGRSGQKYQGQQVYITKINLKGSKPYHISTGSTLGDGDLGWVTLDQLSGYAKGSRGISKNQYAWTQENGAEIIRTSDGALLTPLNRGDQVFTADMSRKLFDFAKSDIPNSLLQNQDLIKNSTTGTVNNQNDITINLPNVTNYEQFKAEMKKDGKLQSWMQEITFGQAIGKNSLRKNNY